MRVRSTLAASLVAVLAGCTVHATVAAGARPVWTAPLPEDVGTLYRALAVDDVVVVVAGSGILAFDRATGTPRWRKPKALNSTATERFVFTDDAMVELGGAVFDLRTGATRFALPARDDVVGLAVMRDALLVATCAGPGIRRSCELSARDLHTGSPLWTTAVPGPAEFALPSPVRALDLVEPMRAPDRGLVAVSTTTRPATLRTLDTRTGAIVRTWTAPDPLDGHYRSRYVGDLLVHADWTAATSPPPRVYDVRFGLLRWGPGTAGGYAFWNSAGVHGSSLLANDHRGPRVVDLETGAVRWTGAEGFRIVGAAGDAAVMLGGGEGRGTPPPRHLSCVDIGTGARRWAIPLDVGDRVDVAVPDGRVVATVQPRLLVLDPRTGARVWSARRDTRLLGAGTDWIVTGRPWHATKGPGEIVLDRP